MVDRAVENGAAAQPSEAFGGCLGQLLVRAGEATKTAVQPESDAAVTLRMLDDLDSQAIVAAVGDIFEHEVAPLGGFDESRQRRAARHTINVIHDLLAGQVAQGETHGTRN